MGLANIDRGLHLIMMITGSRITISMSKIRKSTARRKNRREKGSRALEIGLNPHSNGALISRSFVCEWEVRENREDNIRIMGGSVTVKSIRGRREIMVILRCNFRYTYFVTAYLPFRVEGRAICALLRLRVHRNILNFYYCQVLFRDEIFLISRWLLYRL